MDRIKRGAEIAAAAVMLVCAGVCVFLAAVLLSMNDRIVGEDYLQPYDRLEFTIAMFLVVAALGAVCQAVVMMELPRIRREEELDLGDDTQDRGAVLQVAFDGEPFTGDSQK